MSGMKSTQAMRARCRELSRPELDDYDRAVICIIDDLEALLKWVHQQHWRGPIPTAFSPADSAPSQRRPE